MDFTKDELSLIGIYNAGSRKETIAALIEIQQYLEDDEADLRELTDNAVNKLEKISDEQLFYCQQRGIGEEEAVSLIVNGFCKEVMQHLPMEFAIEAAKLINISLEGSVG